MKDKLLLSIKNKGPEIAIQQLNRQDDVLRSLTTYDEIIKDLYWKEKDLPNVITIAKAGIDHGTTQASLTDNDELAFEYRAIVKTISYNLASFTWPGWNEDGINITSEQVAIGLQAAQTNLDLAYELNREPLRKSYAHWMLAAQYLAGNGMDAANSEFAKAAALALEAENDSAKLLADGFKHLTELLSNPKDSTAEANFSEIKDKFKDLEQGEGYIQQLETAWTVFSDN